MKSEFTTIAWTPRGGFCKSTLGQVRAAPMTDDQNPAPWATKYDKAYGGCDAAWHDMTETQRIAHLKQLRQQIIDDGIDPKAVDRELAKINGC